MPPVAEGFGAALAAARLHIDRSRQPAVEPLLEARTLGPTEVRIGGRPVDGPWLDNRPGQLLKYLLAERRRVAKVDEIGENIWPGSEYAVSANVRYYVHALRRALEPDRPLRWPSCYVLCRAGGYALNLARLRVDADDFEAGMVAGLSKLAAAPAFAAGEIEAAIELYAGEFLTDEPYATWTVAERQRLHELACQGLSALAGVRLAQDRFDDACKALARLAAMQLYDEDVHRRLIEVELLRGHRSDAYRRYSALRSRLRETFGEQPSFTLAELCHRAPG